MDITRTNKKSRASDFIGKIVQVTIDRPLNSKHPKYDWKYELNYGFIPNTISDDGEELDAYVLGVNEPVETFTGKCVAVIHRTDDDDDKLIVIPDGVILTDEQIASATHFQEKFFKSEIIRDFVNSL
ncbi:MAG: inorganic diphosphatase [Candidatus Paceibacterota bacterium]